MNSEQDELLMSQLVDGELPSDQLNELLLGVLADAQRQKRLGQFLSLRNATLDWRRQQPTRPIPEAGYAITGRDKSSRLRMGMLAFAMGVGGLLLLVGAWRGGQLYGTQARNAQLTASQASVKPSVAVQITPEQMHQVAQVFALHESVTGPLAWYAADDQNIRLASAQESVTDQQPIALQLRLTPTDSRKGERTLIIVCREQQPTLIELPVKFTDQAALRMYIDPRKRDGKVDVQYAIAVKGPAEPNDGSLQAVQAGLSGRRQVGLVETSLGQIAMEDRLVNVEAMGWALVEGQH